RDHHDRGPRAGQGTPVRQAQPDEVFVGAVCDAAGSHVARGFQRLLKKSEFGWRWEVRAKFAERKIRTYVDAPDFFSSLFQGWEPVGTRQEFPRAERPVISRRRTSTTRPRS